MIITILLNTPELAVVRVNSTIQLDGYPGRLYQGIYIRNEVGYWYDLSARQGSMKRLKSRASKLLEDVLFAGVPKEDAA